MKLRIFTLCLLLAAPPAGASGQSTPPAPLNPVPATFVEPLPHFQARFMQGDRELTRYHFDPADRRPFLFPITGPSGLSLTRMGHPHDPVSHSHHNSVWISHHAVNGVNFWADAGKNLGRIVPQRIEQFEDADEGAWLTAVNHWVNETSGEVLLLERRRVEVRPLPNHEFLTIIDLEFSPHKQPVTFDKTPFGLVGVRMRKSIGVHDGGGVIRNSEGAQGEKGTDGPESPAKGGVFWKPARWCDYSGPVSQKASEGITLFDHPSNPNHPTVFHVRDDGWMGASLTFDGPRTLEAGTKLRLRYGLYAHLGTPPVAELDARWKSFTELPVAPTLEKQKPAKKP
jgi:hypothetical protein